MKRWKWLFLWPLFLLAPSYMIDKYKLYNKVNSESRTRVMILVEFLSIVFSLVAWAFLIALVALFIVSLD